MTLKDDMEEQWMGLSSNLRRKVNKAQENGINVISGNEELLDDFYSVYSKNIARLGSLAYSKRYFAELIEFFKENNEITE